MKKSTLHLCLASLLSLILLPCIAAYGQLTPSGDSYTNTATSTTNYGAKTLLDVESSQTTFIQFDLSSIPSGYTSADITKATLKLYVNAVTTAGSFNVDYVNGTWTESTIDASNAPALGTTIAASIPLTTKDKNQYILVDVTAAVQAWLSGTANDGIALVANSPLNATFDSKESTSTSHPAELDIVFAGGSGGGISGITTAAGSGLIGGGTSGTLNLSLTNACAANQVLEWNGTAWACANLKGGGTVTSVGSGAGLTGGPMTGSGTLSIPTGGVTNAMLATSYAQLGAANTFTGNQTVTATVIGGTSSSSSAGVLGESNAASGSTYGVGGVAASPSGYGVEGLNVASTGSAIGVYGSSNSPNGYGVEGIDNVSTGFGVGVYGYAASNGGVGVYGTGGPNTLGVYGTETGDGVAVEGDTDVGVGVAWTASGGVGVLAVNETNASATIFAANQTTSAGSEVFVGLIEVNDAEAILGDPGCSAGTDRIALQLSQSGMSNCNNYTLTGGTNGETYLNAAPGETVHLRVNNVDALVASGSGVNVVGTLSKGGGSFKIDHPLDPANKYLYHSFVESPDMKNIYDGTITTDGVGLATVTLPDWFESLNRDFRYQLTVIGQFAQAIVASEIGGNQFGIRTDKPNVKVSWQVTGIRQDAFANANRIPVEVEKAPADRGRYLYPEAIGAPTSARIGYEAPPPGSEQIVHHQRPDLHRGNASPARSITLPVPPKPILPKVAPLPHVASQAHQPEVNQK